MAKHKPSEPAQVVREYGPFRANEVVHGVSFDGERVWFATGKKLRALDPARGEVTHELDAVCDAGTAFDGTHFYQLGQGRIQKLDARTGEVIASFASPGEGRDAGLTWAEGKLWIGKHDTRKIHQIDPTTGALLRTLESNRFVTGITWVDGELWHGTLEQGASELRRIDSQGGEVLESLSMPAGVHVTGLESDGADLFYCGGGESGKLRAVKRPRSR
ncbi:MAG: PQQ-binding-like beta-propeller repeat protein [Myxococcales bacterium]